MRAATDRLERHGVASYATYAEAQRAVDSLADGGFPVEHLTIVADGLQLVEKITGRRGYGDAALSGALSGGLVGAVLGFIFGLFSWVDPLISGLALAFYGFLVGVVAGLVLGLVAHWLSAGRRDFSSVGSVGAQRYEVVADTPEAAERAMVELGRVS